jgi:hypothetical protein
VGPVLDLAVVALSVVVCLSLALLAWTLGVSGVRTVRQERARVGALRSRLAALEREITRQAADANEVLRRLSESVKGDR